jgi:cytochrome P450 family 135
MGAEQTRRSRPPTGLPPGPRMPTPLQALGWALRPLPLLTSSAQRYGGIFTLRVRAGSPWVVLSDPESVKQVFAADPTTQSPSAVEASPTLEPLLGRRSVMLLDEPEHMAHRKLMLPSFHGKRMGAYSEMVVDVARREIATWPSGEQLALWPRMQRISSEVLLRSVFGAIDSEPLQRLRRLLSDLTSWLNDPRRLALVTAVGPRWLSRSREFRAHMRPVEEAVLAEVHRRRVEGSAETGEDLLAMLVRAHAQSGAPLDAHQLRDELITLISDGPTSTSLAWAFERLLRHPNKLARLREEVLDGSGEEYADAVVKETLRLCPVVPLIMRKLLAPTLIAGYTLPAGASVAPSPYLIHRREDLYPRARAFVPERFLLGPAPAYAWIPFGGGVRRCLAAGFAQLTIKRVLQTVLSEVQLRPPRASRTKGASRSSVAFVPDGHALALVTRVSARGGAQPASATPRAA